MVRVPSFWWFCLGLLLPAPAVPAPFLVKDGEPNAEIVVPAEPPRSTRLAAAELQEGLEKISGARLPIVFEPTPGMIPVHVGESRHTAKLGIATEGLKFGAYRIVTGDDWMVLIGDDTDFVPKEPWARNNGDRVSGRLQREWEEASGLALGVPNGGMYKNRKAMTPGLGLPEDAEPSREREYLWGFDERGSFNAVCGFLRKLGVRWYLPGELGEVLPEMTDIPLPEIDETVVPDFPVRQFNIRFGTASYDSMMWAMRLGIRNPYGLMVAHGMHTMTHLDSVLQNHPEWFALYGGKRDTQSGERLNHLCYANEELFEATVKWARAIFDVYDFESVSIMPPDAYIAICQCPLCEGKEVPEMGARGRLSNHVWDFVNRVAREVGKTHPGKWIVCCAYGANTDPPANIEKLEPNVRVVIVGGRRPRNSLPEQREEIRRLREGWKERTSNPYLVFENYPFTGRGFYLPAFVAKVQGESINATKGESLGEDIWLSWSRDFDTSGIGLNHFQVYFTARMYWGGKEADPGELLEEYCRLFYGPAGEAMREFFAYCEAHHQAMDREKEKVEMALSLFAGARALVSPGSVEERRIAVMDAFLETLRNKSRQLSQKRGPLPGLRTVWEPKEPIVIDGKLDDEYWVDCPAASTGSLRELQTGRRPIFETSVQAGWNRAGTELYFGIRCEERPGEELNIATEKNEDQSIWYGDVVEIELGTDSHSYYQIAVNPAGALIDLDRGADKSAWFRWESRAEVATSVGDDHWTVEIRIPVTDDGNDPLNQVVGRKPSASLPWYFNVCRQRIRENGSEYSAFSPTGTKGFHEPKKFAYLYDGRSHRFEVDPTVTDFLIESRSAEEMERDGDAEEAMAAYVALSAWEGATDFQRSDVLARAASIARREQDFDRAAELAGLIPEESVAATVRMENLLAERRWEDVVAGFGELDLSTWPFWQIGAGAFARARAFSAVKDGARAEADFCQALEFTSDGRTRMSILRAMGANRESVLGDPDAALETYRTIAGSTGHGGSAEFYYGIQGAARILTSKGAFDEALAMLDRVEAEKLSGSWRGSMFLARGQTLAAAGREAEAGEMFRKVIADEKAAAGHRSLAEEALK